MAERLARETVVRGHEEAQLAEERVVARAWTKVEVVRAVVAMVVAMAVASVVVVTLEAIMEAGAQAVLTEAATEAVRA